MGNRKEKIAIVTGGAQGIGKAVAFQLAEQGASIVVGDINEEAARQTAADIEGKGWRAISVKVDVGDVNSVNQLIERTLASFSRIDILINNAGITRDNLLIRMGDEDWDAVMKVNLKGVFNCTRAAAKVMMKQRSGRIVSISSIVGLIGNPGQSNYAAAKAGIIGLTKSVARELAPRGITVNAIAPGYIETNMTADLPQKAKDAFLSAVPLGRPGSPEDVAKVVAFLVSDDAAYLTGQTIHVDGGMVMSS
jgi:3-oxoacyl-[acyl-carrier protein] reductase